MKDRSVMMKAMKKALCLLLALALTLALGACGKGGEGEEENNDIQSHFSRRSNRTGHTHHR